jgi:hypothetical protein
MKKRHGLFICCAVLLAAIFAFTGCTEGNGSEVSYKSGIAVGKLINEQVFDGSGSRLGSSVSFSFVELPDGTTLSSLGIADVELTSGKLSYDFPSETPNSLSAVFGTLPATNMDPPSSRFYKIDAKFQTTGGAQTLQFVNSKGSSAELIYASENTSVYLGLDGSEPRVNLSLKKGWNWVVPEGSISGYRWVED